MFLVASGGWKAGSVPASIVAYIISSYNLSQAANVFLSDIPLTGNMWKSALVALANKTTTAGVADADDITFTGVGSSGAATADGLVLVNQTNASNTSLLIGYIGVATGLPFLPNGGDVSVAWDAGANKIFKL
jgi:hypothetical protein